jgi:hypothetical protein
VLLRHKCSQALTQQCVRAAYARAGEREKAQTILKRFQMNESNVSPTELGIVSLSSHLVVTQPCWGLD